MITTAIPLFLWHWTYIATLNRLAHLMPLSMPTGVLQNWSNIIKSGPTSSTIFVNVGYSATRPSKFLTEMQ